jgi:integrase
MTAIETPPVEAPAHPPVVYIAERMNGNGAHAFALRWTNSDGKLTNERLFKTEPNPTQASLRDWRRRAAVAAADKQTYLATPEHLRPGKPVTVAAAVEAYLADIETRLSPLTTRNRRTILYRFLDTLPNQTWLLTALATRHVNGWEREPGYQGRRKQDVAADTLRTELGGIIVFCKWASQTYQWPLPKLTIPPMADRAAPVLIGDEQLRFLLELKGGICRDVLTVLSFTGLRQGELKGLRVQDVVAGVVVVPPGKWARTKNHARRIPLGRRGREICERYAVGREPAALLFTVKGNRIVNQISNWLKSPGPTPHDLRRWFLSSLVRVSCPDKWVDALAGHRQGTDGRYILPTDDELRAFVQRVEDRLLERNNAGAGSPVSSATAPVSS